MNYKHSYDKNMTALTKFEKSLDPNLSVGDYFSELKEKYQIKNMEQFSTKNQIFSCIIKIKDVFKMRKIKIILVISVEKNNLLSFAFFLKNQNNLTKNIGFQEELRYYIQKNIYDKIF